MRRLFTSLWLIPVPVAFAFEVLIGSDWQVVLGNTLAAAASLPVLIRVQRRPDSAPLLRWAVLGLLAALALFTVVPTLSLTTLWLSLVTLAMLTRTASGAVSIAALVILAVANIIVPSFMPDGSTFVLATFALVIAAIAIGLMLRSNDRTLIERQATATEAERRRIATELHDLIAHEVTGIVVLAQAAGRSDNPELKATALTKIEESGSRALEEIRRLVSASRAQDSPIAGASTPLAAARTPVAVGPQSLRDRVAAFGETAQITITTPTEVDAQVWPVLDRVLVESLTNVRRHAGADAAVAVTVTTANSSPESLVMTVTNGPGSGGIGTGSGTGLSSLSVRVGHLGGTIEAGPESGGGWSVRTRVPMISRNNQQAGEG